MPRAEFTAEARRLAIRLRGNATIALHLPMQRWIPYLPRELLEALRDARIRRMVRYAASTVPYYRELFTREDVDPRDIRGADDLDQLPLLDRDVVRRHPRRFVARAPAARGALSFSTSGTTGTPLACFHDPASLLANIAYGERERAPVNKICGEGFRPKELYVGYETSTFKKVTAFYRASTLLPVQPRRRFVSLLEPIEQVAVILNQERPDILVGYGGWLDLFFQTLAVQGIDLHRPKLVMSMGESLSSGARERIEAHFGIPVLSRYNAVESFKIAYCCEERTGFHIHEDLCHVRVVDAEGRSARPGETGQVVLSNLVNRATVLLNYPIHDLAAMSEQPCACGRTFKCLEDLEGRIEDLVHLADGRTIHPRAIWAALKDDREILQYQVIQHAPARFEVFLATSDEPAYQRARGRARTSLLDLLGPQVTLELKRRDDLPWRDGAKFRAVSSRGLSTPSP